MKKLLLILLCFPIIGFGQNVNIPDATFKAYLVGEPLINTNGDTEIQLTEATAFNGTILCEQMTIFDLTGIEDFTALTTLRCAGNFLSSLDLSNNTALTSLDCSGMLLTSLDVSNNTALDSLRCAGNQLTSLDVSNNTALTFLHCSGNQLTSLDVSQNINLTVLRCHSNQLTSLNVSNTALTSLDCNSNQLTSLDVSQNINLTVLRCHSNQLTSLDVSQNINLTALVCGDNPLVYVDLSNTLLDVTNDCDLDDIYTIGYELYMNNMINLEMIFSSPLNGSLSVLEVNNCPNLWWVWANDGELVTLDLSSNTAITNLNCSNNELTSLNISGLTNLEMLNCSNNQLSSLLIPNNDIRRIYCENNALTCINVNNATSLDLLYCNNNLLEQLSIKNNNWSNLNVNASSNNLTCVEVDNIGYATNNWSFDSFTSLTTNCNYASPCITTSAIQEHSTNKELLEVTDLLARKTKHTNQPLLYFYDDGTVEKRIVIE